MKGNNDKNRKGIGSRNPYFKFKQFHIYQDRCAMKVSSDACIFGAYLDLEGAKTVMDIGTGTGLLALMVAQRTEAIISAVEIDENSSIQARENIAHSPWKDRISVHNSSIQKYRQKLKKNCRCFDTIICNPPFYSEKIKSKQPQKRVAWHDESLNHAELLTISADLLTNRGKFHVFIPSKQLTQFNEMSREVELFPYHACFLKPYAASPSHRVIVSYTKTEREVEQDELVIYQSHQVFSGSCTALLSPFFARL